MVLRRRAPKHSPFASAHRKSSTSQPVNRAQQSKHRLRLQSLPATTSKDTQEENTAASDTPLATAERRVNSPPRYMEEVVLVSRNSQAGHHRTRRRHEPQHVRLEVQRQLQVALPRDVRHCAPPSTLLLLAHGNKIDPGWCGEERGRGQGPGGRESHLCAGEMRVNYHHRNEKDTDWLGKTAAPLELHACATR